MNQEYLKKLARLAVEGGANVKKDQLVVIKGDIQAAPLVREIVSAAYDAGAKDCIVRYHDEQIKHEKYLRSAEEVFQKAEPWEAVFNNDSAKQDACYIHVVGGDPDLMKDVDPKRMQSASAALENASQEYRNLLNQGKNAWTIVASATPAWAKKVYPELEEDQALEQLWEDIFSISRVDENDPLDNWKKHSDSFMNRVKKLNDAKFEKLHYQNSAGTDLWVELPENYVYEGGGTVISDGRMTYPNIPTEEIFTAPKYNGVNGKLVSTMPLNRSGVLIKDFWFEFKDGKVVDFDAAQGKETLAELLAADEGASYLGEAALVPWGSPIQKKNRIFYNTLFDENASCHFALGRAYSESIEGGQELSDEELKEKGLNQSIIHVDFMVGSDDLSITGYTKDGKEVPVFVNGRFSDQF